MDLHQNYLEQIRFLFQGVLHNAWDKDSIYTSIPQFKILSQFSG